MEKLKIHLKKHAMEVGWVLQGGKKEERPCVLPTRLGEGAGKGRGPLGRMKKRGREGRGSLQLKQWLSEGKRGGKTDINAKKHKKKRGKGRGRESCFGGVRFATKKKRQANKVSGSRKGKEGLET